MNKKEVKWRILIASAIVTVTTTLVGNRAMLQSLRNSKLNVSSNDISSQQYNNVSSSFVSTATNVNAKRKETSRSTMPTILELVGKIDDYEDCPTGLVLVKDSIDSSFYERPQRKIPNIIHMTSKSRCMTQAFSDNVDKWRFQGYSLFVHDDDAVDRLIHRWWPEFPQLGDTLTCMVPGASIADLWRYLMLWEFGGVYTDIDNAPGPWFWNETGSVITNETDALFEQERDGFPSQYFFAASPRHPVM